MCGARQAAGIPGTAFQMSQQKRVLFYKIQHTRVFLLLLWNIFFHLPFINIFYWCRRLEPHMTTQEAEYWQWSHIMLYSLNRNLHSFQCLIRNANDIKIIVPIKVFCFHVLLNILAMHEAIRAMYSWFKGGIKQFCPWCQPKDSYLTVFTKTFTWEKCFSLYKSARHQKAHATETSL